MNSIETLTTFFGWATLINFGLLSLTSIILMTMQKTIARIHGKLTGLDDAELAKAYFHFLAHYKTIIIVFNLVPYIVLKIMA